MNRINGTSAVQLLECTNHKRDIWRIRWDVHQHENGKNRLKRLRVNESIAENGNEPDRNQNLQNDENSADQKPRRKRRPRPPDF